MNFQNAENETPRAWGDKENRECGSNFRSCQGAGSPSEAVRNQSLRVDRTSWQGSDFASRFRGSTAGGIVIQLIEESREQLDYHVKEVEKLTERLQGLEALQQQLIEKTNE